MLLSGSLRSEFGVCTNEWSPADGRVVHLGYGCGAHSETGQEDRDREIPRATGVVVDELDIAYEANADGASSENPGEPSEPSATQTDDSPSAPADTPAEDTQVSED